MEQKTSLYDKVKALKTAPVIFLHIDTTGLGADDVVVRITIISDDTLVYDEIYHTNRPINEQASRISGISQQDIFDSDVYLRDEVSSLEYMLADKLLICVNDSFTKNFLARSGLEIDDKNLLDLTKATDFFASGFIKSSRDMLSFYGYDVKAAETTFDRNFILYDCAWKLKTMANSLLKE